MSDPWERLVDFMIEDILEMSDEEVLAEYIEDGGDLKQLEAEWEAFKAKVLAR